MAEIQRAGAHFEGIFSRNVLHMHFSAAVNQLFHGWHFPVDQRGRVFVNKVKKSRVFDQRYLNGFGNARAPVPVVQGAQKSKIVEYGEGRGEGAQEVLLNN